MRNQKGFAHILGLLVLLAGLGASVYLVQQKTNLFSKAASAPIGGCKTDANCPSGYKCQIQATTLRQCPVSAPNCNAVVGKCVPLQSSKPQPSVKPSELFTTMVTLYSFGGGVTPQASGQVWVQILNYNMGTDLGTVNIQGSLKNLMPGRVYRVMLCGSDGVTCGTNTNPKIITDARGNTNFSGLTFNIYNRSTNSISDVKVIESPPPGPIAPHTCSLASSPCLTGGYTMPRIWITPTPRLTPGPTSIPTSRPTSKY